jgi:hypothetical protein
MKKTLLLVLFGLFLSMQAYAQYNYQNGLLPVNGITFKIHRHSNEVSLENTINSLSTQLITHSNVDCGSANFNEQGYEAIKNVFKQVFLTKHHILLFVYADAGGKIQEVAFIFSTSSPVMPTELYQLEIALKALPALNYTYPSDCTGVNYRVDNMPIYINELD